MLDSSEIQVDYIGLFDDFKDSVKRRFKANKR